MANDRKDSVSFMLKRDDDGSSDDYRELAATTRFENVAAVGCMLWGLAFVIVPFLYIKGISYFSDVSYPAGFWAAAITPWIAFAVGTSIASFVAAYHLGAKAAWLVFKRVLLRRNKAADFEGLLSSTVWVFLAVYFAGVAFVAVPAAITLATVAGLPLAATVLQMSLYCGLVCGFAVTPYMTGTI